MLRKLSFVIILLLILCACVMDSIFAQIHTQEKMGLSEVLPEAVSFEPIKKNEETLFYKAVNKEGKLIGAVFKTKSKGYSSDIETLVGMLKDGTITAIKVLSEDETPSLGGRVREYEFTNQFRSLKDISRVQAITGATVSSSAVIESVKTKAEEIKGYLN